MRSSNIHDFKNQNQIIFYDNTAGSGTVLFSIYVTAYAPVIFNLKDIGPIRFNTGLTVVVPASSACFLVSFWCKTRSLAQ